MCQFSLDGRKRERERDTGGERESPTKATVAENLRKAWTFALFKPFKLNSLHSFSGDSHLKIDGKHCNYVHSFCRMPDIWIRCYTKTIVVQTIPCFSEVFVLPLKAK